MKYFFEFVLAKCIELGKWQDMVKIETDTQSFLFNIASVILTQEYFFPRNLSV